MKFDEIISYERQDVAEEHVRNLFVNGVSIEVVIASITGLSEKRIRQIYDEVKDSRKSQLSYE